MKFKTKPMVVEAIRITDKNVGTPGSWLVLEGTNQTIVSNKDFVNTYRPAGRGDSKTAYENSKSELETPETTTANVVSGATT